MKHFLLPLVTPKWMPGQLPQRFYSKVFRGDNPNGQAAASVITYEYKKESDQCNQAESLFRVPILRPSELGVARYSDKNFNPNAFTSGRFP